jgi:LacI family transcriptional regulator
MTSRREAAPSMQFVECLRGASGAMGAADVPMRVEFLADGAAPEPLVNSAPGGILVDTQSRALKPTIRAATKAGVPLVQLGFDTEEPTQHAVVVDSFGGALDGVRHLTAAGHTRIGTIRWNHPQIRNSAAKNAGYRAALAEAELPIRPEYEVNAVRSQADLADPSQERPARTALDQLLALPEPPSAVFVENSFLSLPLIFPLRQDRGDLPPRVREIDFVHFEDVPLEPHSSVVGGTLNYERLQTSVLRINWEQIGRLAAEFMVQLLTDTAPPGPHQIRVAPALTALHPTG